MKASVICMIAAGLLTSSAYARTHYAQNTHAVTPVATPAAAAATSSIVKPGNINDVSYSFGYTMGTNMKRQKMDLDIEHFIAGMQDAIAGKESKFSRDEMVQMLMGYQREIVKKQAEDSLVQAQKNKKEGEDFLAANKSKEGVVTLPSGLQYKIITKGTGATPTVADRVKVNYSGRLINGEVFSSSEDSANPVMFSLNQVIPGWKEALQLMKEGATWELYVPSNLAYGARGTHGQIGPNATLIFTISLISIEKDQDVSDEAPQSQQKTQ